jgi:chemotaxis protein CheD
MSAHRLRRPAPAAAASVALPLPLKLCRYWDPRSGLTAVKIAPGEHYVTADPGEMLVTVLGSCVAACIRDPALGLGGMNHFMLPGEGGGRLEDPTPSMRYGSVAMERLINDILARGGRRGRLEVKVFGGGNVLASSNAIGSGNADWVERWLAAEDLPVAAADLRGDLPRRVHYVPATGRVLLLALRRSDAVPLVDDERRYRTLLQSRPVEGPAELF